MDDAIAPMPTAVFAEFTGEGAATPGAGALKKRVDGDFGLPRPTLTVDAGTGIIACFDRPLQTLDFVDALAARARSSLWGLPPVHMGLHVANMSRSGGTSNLSSGSMETAMRVGRLAGPHQALATHQFQTLVVHLLKVAGDRLRPLGRRTGTDGRPMDVFEVASGHAPAPPDAPLETMPAAVVTLAERLLAQEIGPIARLLVRQACPEDGAIDRREFARRLSMSIPDAARRRKFLAALEAAAVPAVRH
jgi:hypothetical protein